MHQHEAHLLLRVLRCRCRWTKGPEDHGPGSVDGAEQRAQQQWWSRRWGRSPRWWGWSPSRWGRSLSSNQQRRQPHDAHDGASLQLPHTASTGLGRHEPVPRWFENFLMKNFVNIEIVARPPVFPPAQHPAGQGGRVPATSSRRWWSPSPRSSRA